LEAPREKPAHRKFWDTECCQHRLVQYLLRLYNRRRTLSFFLTYLTYYSKSSHLLVARHQQQRCLLQHSSSPTSSGALHQQRPSGRPAVAKSAWMLTTPSGPSSLVPWDTRTVIRDHNFSSQPTAITRAHTMEHQHLRLDDHICSAASASLVPSSHMVMMSASGASATAYLLKRFTFQFLVLYLNHAYQTRRRNLRAFQEPHINATDWVKVRGELNTMGAIVLRTLKSKNLSLRRGATPLV